MNSLKILQSMSGRTKGTQGKAVNPIIGFRKKEIVDRSRPYYNADDSGISSSYKSSSS
jgi:hypothetical protein